MEGQPMAFQLGRRLLSPLSVSYSCPVSLLTQRSLHAGITTHERNSLGAAFMTPTGTQPHIVILRSSCRLSRPLSASIPTRWSLHVTSRSRPKCPSCVCCALKLQHPLTPSPILSPKRSTPTTDLRICKDLKPGPCCIVLAIIPRTNHCERPVCGKDPPKALESCPLRSSEPCSNHPA
jgi:hypothetical protein